MDRQVDKRRKGKFGPMYILIHENYLKNFSETFGVADQSSNFLEIKIDPKTHEKRTEVGKTLLPLVGIK